MDAERIAAIRARLDAATAGPWPAYVVRAAVTDLADLLAEVERLNRLTDAREKFQTAIDRHGYVHRSIFYPDAT